MGRVRRVIGACQTGDWQVNSHLTDSSFQCFTVKTESDPDHRHLQGLAAAEVTDVSDVGDARIRPATAAVVQAGFGLSWRTPSRRLAPMTQQQL